MKNLILTASVMIVSVLTGCTAKQKTAEELLKDPKTEQEIYSAILSDKEHLSAFMEKMLADKDCRELMTASDAFVKMACMSAKMDSIISNDKLVLDNITGIMIRKMSADSITCDHTCTKMMEDESIKTYLKKQPLQKRVP